MSLNPLFVPLKSGLFLAGLAFALWSCEHQNSSVYQQSGKPVASVGEDTLYDTEINHAYRQMSSASIDSQAWAERYIKRWIEEKTIFQKAMEELPEKKKDKAKALQRYYESLIRHTYRTRFVNNKVNQQIRDDTLRGFYEANRSQFTLKGPVCKVRYMALPQSAPKQSQVAAWFRSSKNYHLDSLFGYAQRHARSYSLDPERWFYYASLKQQFQLPDGAKEFLSRKTVYQSALDSATNLYLSIQHYRLPGDVAPFPLVSKGIRQRFLNDRKQSLLKNMEQAAVRQAKQKDKVKRYE